MTSKVYKADKTHLNTRKREDEKEMPTFLHDMQINKISLVDRGANKKKFFLFKSEGDQNKTNMPENKETKENKEEKELSLESLQEKIEELEKENKEFKEKLESKKEENPENKEENPEEEVEKEGKKDETPEEIRKELSDLRKELKEAKEEAKAEREARLEKEYLEKAEKYDFLPNVEKEDLAKMLKDAGDKEETLTKFLDSVNEVVKQSGILKEVGATGQKVNGAEEKIEARAKEIMKDLRKKDPEANESTLKAKALEIAIKENPEAYDEHVEGFRQATFREYK